MPNPKITYRIGVVGQGLVTWSWVALPPAGVVALVFGDVRWLVLGAIVAALLCVVSGLLLPVYLWRRLREIPNPYRLS